MEWIEIAVTVDAADCDAAADIATMAAPGGISIEDYSDMDATLPAIGWVDAIDEALLARDRTRATLRLYLPANENPAEAAAFIGERLRAAEIVYKLETLSVDDADWNENWKKYYKPLHIGERLVIVPSWEDYAPKAGEVVVGLDPGAAFGTGTHETTRLCLELVEQAVTPGCTVLDVGCGSGILSIAALLLGAARAVALDIDKNAAATAAENAARNGLDDGRYTALAGDIARDAGLRAQLAEGYDLVCANIVADVILSMRTALAQKTRAGGTLVVSGILETRADEVCAALEAQGLRREQTAALAGWTAIRFRR